MKKTLAIVLATVMLLSLVPATAALAAKPMNDGENYNGNGAPSGKHYNLNIIGAPKDKRNWDGDSGGNGARIFVDRTGQTVFWVGNGTSFAITDHDGTDGKVGTGIEDPGIIFPYNPLETEHTWRVEIYIRMVGPKGSGSDWASYVPGGTGFTDPNGDEWGLWDSFSLAKGEKFQLKTGSLLANRYEDMLWTLNPTGKFRICQMRIYLLDFGATE